MDTPQRTDIPQLMVQTRGCLRALHYSLRTEETYLHWIRRFLRFHGKRHPLDMNAPHVSAFLSYLATELEVAAATQNLALAAVLFLYKEVLQVDLPWLKDVVRAKRSQRLPTVLSVNEVNALLAKLHDDEPGLVVRLLYGTGMRLMEALRLRVKDVDFERRQVIVREGKGGKDRVVMRPRTLVGPLRHQLATVRRLWEDDRAAQRNGVQVPHAFASKSSVPCAPYLVALACSPRAPTSPSLPRTSPPPRSAAAPTCPRSARPWPAVPGASRAR